MLISEKKIEILKALSKYKYLTVSQIIDLGITSSIETVRKYLTALKKDELINSTRYSGAVQQNDKSKIVKFEGLHFLDKKGVHFLQENFDFDNIKYPKNYKLAFSNDYLHRVLMISTCISFEKWRKEKDLKGGFLVDFHNSETTVKIDEKLIVKPDIVVSFNQNMAIVEVWAGFEKEYIVNQLSKLIKGVGTNKVSEFLKYDRTPRILNIFKDSGVMQRVRQELKTDPYFINAVNKGLFYFATMDDIKRKFNFWQDINENWLDIDTF
jgi:DNA-binding transcriptional ArsR family regulator